MFMVFHHQSLICVKYQKENLKHWGKGEEGRGKVFSVPSGSVGKTRWMPSHIVCFLYQFFVMTLDYKLEKKKLNQIATLYLAHRWQVKNILREALSFQNQVTDPQDKFQACVKFPQVTRAPRK